MHRALRVNQWMTEHDEYMHGINQKIKHKTTATVTDVDLVYRRRFKDVEHILIVEMKCQGKPVSTGQAFTYKIIARGLQELDTRRVPVTVHHAKGSHRQKVRFRGAYELTFENTTFDNGRAWLNGHLVTEQQYLRFVSFDSPDRAYNMVKHKQPIKF